MLILISLGQKNKLASLEAPLVRNYDLLTHLLTYLLTRVKTRATSVAKTLLYSKQGVALPFRTKSQKEKNL